MLNKYRFPDPLSLIVTNSNNQPNHIAIQENKRKITYKEFIDLADSMAYQFRKKRKHPKVLIYLPQSIEAYASMIGCLQAGGIYSPIGINTPYEKQKLILSQFEPDLIITDQNKLKVFSKNCEVVDISDVSQQSLGYISEPHELAYVIFTSGTTGIPKGVKISRQALAHYIDWVLSEMKISQFDRWSQHPNVGFDLSVLDIYGSLCGGATLVPVNNARDKLFPLDFIKKNKLTIWNSVPSVVDLMIKSNKMKYEYLSSLRMFTFCGEPLHKHHLEAIFKVCPEVTVQNTYGPTEATVSFTSIKLNKNNFLQACDGNNVAFGDPIPRMEINLINGKNKNEGELVISGPQLSNGYWNDNTKTKQAFKTIVLNGTDRFVYMTGDYCYKKSGNNFFYSRIDNQIKINGYRLELGEVDSAFNSAGVKICCTIKHGEKIYTFIQDQNNLNMKDINSYIFKVLPSYGIPSNIFIMKNIPRNSNDKIDRHALAEYCDNFKNNKKQKFKGFNYG
tara:strand:+ start:5952 stop:7466 length:1515 start_codon:yes stop_codon:yes gene_type:complete